MYMCFPHISKAILSLIVLIHLYLCLSKWTRLVFPVSAWLCYPASFSFLPDCTTVLLFRLCLIVLSCFFFISAWLYDFTSFSSLPDCVTLPLFRQAKSGPVRCWSVSAKELHCLAWLYYSATFLAKLSVRLIVLLLPFSLSILIIFQ